jgi:RND family efflux transporter MFP subunit
MHLHKDIKYIAILGNGSPKVVTLATNRDIIMLFHLEQTMINPNWIAISVLTGAAMMLAACERGAPVTEDPVRPVRAIKVGEAGPLADRSFPGRARAHNEADLSFRVAGPLIVLPSDIVGREYKEGEVISRIDPRDYEVKVADINAQLARARASAKRAASDYKRELNIFKKDPGATSQTALDRRSAQRDQTAADEKSLLASQDAAQDQLEYTYLKAPFAGKVVQQYVQNFEDVRAKQAIVRLLDTSRIEMVVNIPENMISNAPYVTNIRVRFDAFKERVLPAVIKEIGAEASRTTRTYPVTLLMDQPEDIKILPGMAGRATADQETAEDRKLHGITVPISAIFSPEDNGSSYAWVFDEQATTVSRREVTTGELTDYGVRVREGLEPGQWVVTAGVSYLKEGQTVKLLED